MRRLSAPWLALYIHLQGELSLGALWLLCLLWLLWVLSSTVATLSSTLFTLAALTRCSRGLGVPEHGGFLHQTPSSREDSSLILVIAFSIAI
jgi:hypothetical protein